MAEKDQSRINKDIKTIPQKEGLLSPSTQVMLVIDKKAETTNISETSLGKLTEITPRPMKVKTDILTELVSSNKELDTERQGNDKLPIHYLFSFDTISATNHCCLRMMKAAKTCLLKSGYNVAGCFISMKNKGCLETMGKIALI